MKLFQSALLGLAAVVVTGCGMLPRLADFERVERKRQSENGHVVDMSGAMMQAYREPVEAALSTMSDRSFVDRHARILEVINGAPATAGNDSRILLDGPQTWQAIFTAMATARDHIHIESFIFEDLVFGSRLSDLLVAKAKDGVAVRVIYDSVGSSSTPRDLFQRLATAGIALCEFNPTSLAGGKLLRLNHRDHRKIVLVDGKVAFTGGINFHSVYRTGSAMQFRTKMPTIEEGWRDTHVELAGPSVHELQSLFLSTWNKQGCAEQPVRDHFPTWQSNGPHTVAIVGSSPDAMLSRMYLLLVAGIAYSRHSVWLTTAYFAPDPDTIRVLSAAARRGVDVRLLLPGFTDSFLAFHAGRSHYEALLNAGVKIYEQRDALLHAKTAVIDGVWSTIGSSNVDWRSFCHNDEINALFLGANFGSQMRQVFEDDLALAHEVTLGEWQGRSTTMRFREWFASQFDYLL